MIEFRFDSVTFSDGTSLDLDRGSIVAVVGPNNSGKSEAIRNLAQSIAAPVQGPVITAVSFAVSGDSSVFEAWLANNATEITRPDGAEIVSRVGPPKLRSKLLEEWQDGPPFQNLATFVSIVAMAESRLALVKEVKAFATRTEHPSNALQYLYLNPDSEQSLSDSIRAAFGTGIVVDRTGGSKIYLLYGEAPIAAATIPPTKEYLDQISALKQVEEQGDGVKSFTGLSLAVETGIYPVVLIDEPEAFLHPPQAKLLGRRLAAHAKSETQVILATHSSDVLQGLIEESPDAVNVVRLTRTGAVNPTAVLSASELAALWKDPLLRYSNILDGLFHDRVVVCESDSDCRFYGAVLDELQNTDDVRGQEVLFTHAGGKARIHSVVAALVAVAVPVSVVADIDLLRSPSDVKRIYESLNAEWAVVEPAVLEIKAIVDALASETLVEQVIQDFSDVFDGKQLKDRVLAEDVRLARSKLKIMDGWSRLKSAGFAGMPKGQPTRKLKKLLEELSRAGLHIVPVGELEGFAPDIDGHGPHWAIEALKAGAHQRSGSRAHEFLAQVLDPDF